MTFASLFLQATESSGKRRELRKNQTKAEYVLWQELRGRKLGFIFRRQFSIGRYIVDFYCDQLRLIIELDGPIHEHQERYDRKREEWLKANKYTVLRFTNDQALFHRDIVLNQIQAVCQQLCRSTSIS